MYFIALIPDLRGRKKYPQGNYSMMGTSPNTSLKRFLMVRCIFCAVKDCIIKTLC